MTNSYTQLGALLDRIGTSRDAAQMVPRMFDYTQRTDRFGRQIVEFGTGTGEGIITLADSGYKLTGIDESAEMLAIARGKSSTVDWLEADIRQPAALNLSDQDLVVAVDVLNDLESLRDLQAVFTSARKILRENRLFIFDILTVEGITQMGISGDSIIYADDIIIVMASHNFDYERQEATRNLVTFERDETGDTWTRRDAVRVLRAYPVQAMAALLQRAGFGEVSVFTTAFTPFNGGNADRLILVAAT